MKVVSKSSGALDRAFLLNPTERAFLFEKALVESEISAIERFLAGGTAETSDIVHPRIINREADAAISPDYHCYGPGEKVAEFNPDGGFAVVDSEVQDREPVKAIWESKGIVGVLMAEGPSFMTDTNYGLREGLEIQSWFRILQLTPEPTEVEIEKACGVDGLHLPSVVIENVRYFDCNDIDKTIDEKANRQAAYDQVREPVLPYLL